MLQEFLLQAQLTILPQTLVLFQVVGSVLAQVVGKREEGELFVVKDVEIIRYVALLFNLFEQ